LTEYLGYDIKLSARFKNLGAPKFMMKKDKLKIVYSLEVGVYDEEF